MKEPLIKVVLDFLSIHYLPEKPVLIGYSGGVDSTALLFLLMEMRSFFPSLDLRIVHFDHAWRAESSKEAIDLRNKIEDLGLVFYSERSSKQTWKEGNKEEKAREERYLFFKKIYDEVKAQALVLAHQREDLAETILKRFCEGSGLVSLSGMQPKSLYKEMVLWRPLLSTPKKALLEWNQKNHFSYFLDYTNEDLQFLRPRMRKKIFPELEQWFGKGVQKNIALLGEEFSLLKEYIERKTDLLIKKKILGSLGFCFLSRDLELLEELERRELIRRALKEEGVVIGKQALKQIESLRRPGVFNKKVDVSKGRLIANQGDLFWFKEDRIEWEFSDTERPVSFSLESFLQGKISYKCLKNEEVVICKYSSLSAKEQKKVSSFFSRNKLPSIMKEFFPFLKKNESIINLCFFCDDDLILDNYSNFLTIKLKNTSN